jgi:cytoskeleton protein RodZ
MNEVTKTPEEAKMTASMKLVAARESLGMSQEDVAGGLYLKIAFIRHIDEGEFDKISKQAFIKGYLRSYAKMVKVDGDEVVKLYDAESNPQAQYVEFQGVTQGAVGSKNFTGPILQTGIFGLLALTIVAGAVWYYASDESVPQITTPPTETQPERSAPGSETSAGAVVTQDPVEPSVTEALPEEPSPEASSTEQAQTEEPVSESQQAAPDRRESLVDENNSRQDDNPLTASDLISRFATSETELVDEDLIKTERETIGALRYITITALAEASGDDNMRFVFDDDCWIEIKDVDDNVMFTDLGRPGNILLVKGSAPFEVLLGKATGVTMEFNGESIDLARFTSSDDTAKVMAGG